MLHVVLADGFAGAMTIAQRLKAAGAIRPARAPVSKLRPIPNTHRMSVADRRSRTKCTSPPTKAGPSPHHSYNRSAASFVHADDLRRDGTSAVIDSQREQLLQEVTEVTVADEAAAALDRSGVTARMNKRTDGRPPMQANKQRPETKYLESLGIDEINAKIEERKADIIEKHIAAGTHANWVTAMSQYIEFCEIKGKQPIRIGGLVKTLSKIEIRMNEDIMIDFAVYESWRVSPPVVAQYVSHVFNWHIMELGIDMKEGTNFLRLAKVLKGINKLFPHEHWVRLGLKPAQMKAILWALARRMWHHNQTPASWFAYRFGLFLAWCFQGLYRGGEGAQGLEFDPSKHLTCTDPKIEGGGKVVTVKNPELKVRNRHSGVPFPFLVDACDMCSFGHWFSLRDTFDPLDPGEDPETTPLFADPRKGGAGRIHSVCLSYDDALKELRALIASELPALDVSLYGLHSMRIGAASSLFALGCPPLVIQTLCRWSLDMYELYCCANREQLTAWTAKLSTADFVTLEEMQVR